MRQRFHKIALLVFFVIYALSPLTYDLSARSVTSDLCRGTSERSVSTISLHLIEVLCEAFAPPDDPINRSSPKSVFIKKKSAIQRGRFDLAPLSGRIASFATADLTAFQHFSIERAGTEISRPWLRKNNDCLPHSSGLSPPLLS